MPKPSHELTVTHWFRRAALRTFTIVTTNGNSMMAEIHETGSR